MENCGRFLSLKWQENPANLCNFPVKKIYENGLWIFGQIVNLRGRKICKEGKVLVGHPSRSHAHWRSQERRHASPFGLVTYKRHIRKFKKYNLCPEGYALQENMNKLTLFRDMYIGFLFNNTMTGVLEL